MAIYFAGLGASDNITTNFVAPSGSAFLSYTVSCWFYMNTIDPFDYRLIAFFHAASRKVGGLTLSPNGAINFGNESVDLVGPVANTGQWIHACSVASATSTTSAKVKGYINGTLVASAVVASGSYGGQSGYSLVIGASSDLFLGIDGYTEDARFWTRTLSATEVLQEYRASEPNQFSLVGWNPMRDNYIRDQSRGALSTNNATWTASGTAPTVVVSAMSANRSGTNTTTFARG